jgi:hypothetical protein
VFVASNLSDTTMCDNMPAVVTKGSGNYAVTQWTLLLRFPNGVTNLWPLQIPDEEQDLQNIGRFKLGVYEFVRRPR